jgi:hypothetical protein
MDGWIGWNGHRWIDGHKREFAWVLLRTLFVVWNADEKYLAKGKTSKNKTDPQIRAFGTKRTYCMPKNPRDL